MKWSRKLALAAVPLAVAVAGVLAAPAAWATSCDTAVITVQPTTTQVNLAMKPAVTVLVELNGKIDRSYSGPVTLSYAVDEDGAPAPAGASVRAVSGVATFSGLKFSAVGFGFELRAALSSGTPSAASAPFDIVDQLLQCTAGKPCSSKPVSSDGTSATVTAAAAASSDVLTATGGGFPALSCTAYGGVVSFSVTDRSKVITATLDKSLTRQAVAQGVGKFALCYGSPAPFVTASGKTAAFSAADDEYEGLLPDCTKNGSSPCVQHRSNPCLGPEVITVTAPAGDPRMTF
jgi:hypothetical protein